MIFRSRYASSLALAINHTLADHQPISVFGKTSQLQNQKGRAQPRPGSARLGQVEH